MSVEQNTMREQNPKELPLRSSLNPHPADSRTASPVSRLQEKDLRGIRRQEAPAEAAKSRREIPRQVILRQELPVETTDKII